MKRIFILAASILVTVTAAAQEGLNRQVEVTKAYAPEVDAAEKLQVAPRMEDTVALHPDISYSIRPAAWQTAFGVKSIAAASVDARLDNPQPFVWIRAGVGFPFRSLADAYIHNKGLNGHLGAYLNHRGQYADIENDLSVETPATLSHNALGAYGAAGIGARTQAGGSLDLTYDYATRYGLATPDPASEFDPGKASIQSYTGFKAGAWLGNDFSDLSNFNFRLGVNGGVFSDRQKNSENNFAAYAGLGKAFNASTITLFANLDGYYGDEDRDYYKNTIFSISPSYSLEKEKFKFTLGATLSLDNMKDHNAATRVFPVLKLTWDAAQGYFVPFIEIDGGLENNGMASLARRNPYVEAGADALKNTARYNAHGGISGSFSSAFSYKAFGGVSLYRDRVTFGYLYRDGASGSFLPLLQDVTQITIGGDISARVAGNFEATLQARMHAYPDNDDNEKAAEMPDFEVGLGAKYNPMERLSLSAGIDVTGRRYFYGLVEFTDGWQPFLDEKVSPAANLYFKAEYRLRKRWGFFVEADNILGSKMYPYNHYRGVGASVLGGVSLRLGQK